MDNSKTSTLLSKYFFSHSTESSLAIRGEWAFFILKPLMAIWQLSRKLALPLTFQV